MAERLTFNQDVVGPNPTEPVPRYSDEMMYLVGKSVKPKTANSIFVAGGLVFPRPGSVAVRPSPVTIFSKWTQAVRAAAARPRTPPILPMQWRLMRRTHGEPRRQRRSPQLTTVPRPRPI